MVSYTVKTAAEALAMTSRAIRAAIHRRDIRAVKIGRGYRIPSNEIERLLNAKEEKGES